MKSLFFVFLLLFSFRIVAQTITTIPGTSGGAMTCPEEMAIDKFGNFYVPSALGNVVYKIDTADIVSIIAGTGTAGYTGDSGLATSAEIRSPVGIAVDTFCNVFFTDCGNNRVRKIESSTGIITTIAGNGSPGYSGDNGLAINASLWGCGGLCFDKYYNLYIADCNNNRIRKINTVGIITTVAGNGTAGSMGDGGLAVDAECIPVYNMIIDPESNMYFIDETYSTIRRINPDGVISTIAGCSDSANYCCDNVPALGASMSPQAIAFNVYGDLFLSDGHNNRIREIDNTGIIHTISGNGVYGNTGDFGSAIDAEIGNPSGLVFDSCDNLIFAQCSDHPSLRKIAFNPSCLPLSTPQVTKSQLNIYPNPATEKITIENAPEGRYRLINITGTIMQQGVLKEGNNSISVRAISSGIYLLVLTDSEGKRVVSTIVKE